MYIVFEGVVGVGKTTQSKRLVTYLQEKFPHRRVLWTREPGGSVVAEKIRKVVQGTTFFEGTDPVCEAYLYAASRAQTLRTVVKPALEQGDIVIADRSFLTSISWQGFGRGMGFEKVYEINKVAIEDCQPDAILYLDIDVRKGMARTFDADGDKFETFPPQFFERCRDGYTFLSHHPLFRDKWHTVDASGSIDEVFALIVKEIDKM